MKALVPMDSYTVPLTGSNLVEAAAGTGKTWTIAALYLRLVLEKMGSMAYCSRISCGMMIC